MGNEFKELEEEISRFRNNMYGVENIADYLDDIRKNLKLRNKVDENKIEELEKIKSDLEELNNELSSRMVNHLKEYREATEKVTNIDRFIKEEKLMPESEAMVLFDKLLNKIEDIKNNSDILENIIVKINSIKSEHKSMSKNYNILSDKLFKIKEKSQNNLEYSFDNNERIKNQEELINSIKKDIYDLSSQVKKDRKKTDKQLKIIYSIIVISILIRFF